MARCVHRHADNSQCKRIVETGKPYCYSHDPSRQEERKRNARKGGRRAGRGRPSPATAELVRLQSHFEGLADKVLTGEVDRGDAAVVAQLLNGARSCVIGLLKAKEVEELEARLEEVEALLAQRKETRWRA